MTSPRWATLLVGCACPADEREDLLANLADEADAVAASRGLAAARTWYWQQALSSLAPLLRRRLTVAVRAIGLAFSRWPMLSLRSDLSLWLRRLRRRPLVPVTVLTIIGASIAAVTAVMSVANAVLFKPLPLPDSDRIVRFYTNLPGPGTVGSINLPDLTDVAHASRTLLAVAPFSASSMTWQRRPEVESLAVAKVGRGYLDVMGLRMTRGRWFDPSEFAAGADAVAVITNGFWHRTFGARDDAVGQVIDLDDRHVQIVGVLPPTDFLFPAAAELWMPLAIEPSSYLNGRMPVQVAALGRIRADQSFAAAAAELAAVNHGLQMAYPHEAGQRSLLIRRLRDTLAGPVRPMLLLLMAAATVVLLLAAANIADLLLVDAASRRSEFAIRQALGAAGPRLVKQIVVETCSLVGLGGALGLAFAPILTGLLVRSYPTPLPRVTEIGLDGRALAAGIAATCVAAVWALVPLIRVVSRFRIIGGLREGGRSVTGGARRLTALLVVAQVALSVLLLSAGILIARTFMAAAGTDVGFEPADALTFNVALGANLAADPARAAAAFRALSRQLRTLPGVRSVGATLFLPFAPGMWGDSFARVGTATDVAPRLPAANVEVITPELPPALGIALRKGRLLSDHDTAQTDRVVLVNETLERHWLDGAGLGRRLVWGNQTWEVVGVLADAKRVSVVEPPADELYFVWAQFPFAETVGWIVVRGDDGRALLAMVPTFQAEIARMNPLAPVTKVGLMADRMADVVAPERFRATLVGALGLAAVVLAVLGLVGILAQRVAAQTREIGVRLALGEPAGRIRRRVVWSGIRLSAVGIVAGLLLALWSAPFVQGFLTTGLRATDPLTLTGVSVGLFAVALAAAWVPARRASHVDPLAALRVD